LRSLQSVFRAAALLGMLLTGSLWLGDPVRADVLLPNQKQISYCFEVTGMDAYPDYVFLAYFSRATGGHTTIDTGKCVGFYKLAVPMLYAIRRSLYATSMPPTERQAEQTYFTTNPNLIRSDIGIHSPGAVDKSDPIDEIVDVFHVASVDDTKLNIVPESVRYTFSDGKKVTVPWTSGDRPAPSRGAASVTSGGMGGNRARVLFALGVTAAALIGIVGVIVWQERQRGPRPPPAR
jgi:hypothetical protein